MPSDATIEIAKEIREYLASDALTEGQAKLYSQRLRREMGREGLVTFSENDVALHLDHAILLLTSALLERDGAPNRPWRQGVKRAAEILEWLCQPTLRPAGVPVELIAAAAYQLADYPAMALGVLKRVPNDDLMSRILRNFLQSNFPRALEAIRDFWRNHRALNLAERIDSQDITSHTFQHVVMCLGAICIYLRNGEDAMATRAISKLERLAISLLHSRDPYSYLLATLTAAVSNRFIASSFWINLERLQAASTAAAREALVQFMRSAFANNRALVWPAQAVGIRALVNDPSFVLCTPTGSGKTTIATLATIQSLFADPVSATQKLNGPLHANLVLYLVPSRALAAEVEARFAQDLSGIAADPIVVTGLYGGIDWGPTDAWIQADRPTIVICTFEKADALLRYLGVLFLSRVRLAVIDEAHMVEQDPSRLVDLLEGTSRAYRLEQLGSRLLRARDEHGFRIVALSAVAARAAPALARWVGSSSDAVPTTSSYRSTRQMLGRLEVDDAGQFEIHYDLMDGRSLQFEEEQRFSTPYVPKPFGPVPGGLTDPGKPELRMRAPTLWAALQLAGERQDGTSSSVLISITQNIEGFAASCAALMDQWSDESLPNYRSTDVTDTLWQRCLASAADYFSIQSTEYRLLEHGIAVHHGKMPVLLARRLKAVIDRGLVRIIIATSTLSEGVNIPVSYLLMPSVYRGTSPFSLQEFSNVIGRAGRPGVSTEGSALVVLPKKKVGRRGGRPIDHGRQWDGYEELVSSLETATSATGAGTPQDNASSALGRLLGSLHDAWSKVATNDSDSAFETWLEQTAVSATDDPDTATQYLDSLDTFLLAAIHEVEELRESELMPAEMEAELISIWRRTYAFAAANEEERLRTIWVARGRAIKTLYPDVGHRRRIYRSSLSPRSATRLLDRAEAVRAELVAGADYAIRSAEQQLDFLRKILATLSEVPSFRISTILGRKKNFDDWPKLLRWWLLKSSLPRQPKPNEITNWYDFVSKNFVYRGAWGLGSLIGVLLDGVPGQPPIKALEIADWPRSGLPWIAFWIKELITWGTLDPVAAFLLARGDAIDRPQAERDAKAYYENQPDETFANDILDPRRIRDWVELRAPRIEATAAPPTFDIPASLAQPAQAYRNLQMFVLPLETDDGVIWVDAAGYTVGRSAKPDPWVSDPSRFEFELSVRGRNVVGQLYRPHSTEHP